jgi:16S rRNA (cytosine967-C5)-methyltransferase
MPAKAREYALKMLNAVDLGVHTLDALLCATSAETATWDSRERALLNALVFGVLRWRGRLDWMIAFFSKTGKKKIHPVVFNILRLGLFQIIYLDRIPVSAAVNTSVELAKSHAAPWVVRYVNGLLRNAARNYATVPFPDMAKQPAAALAANCSFPPWLVNRWLKRFGPEETRAACEAVNRIPPLTLRINRLKATRAKVIQALEAKAEKIERTRYAPDALMLWGADPSLFTSKSFQSGDFAVQDEAAQLVGWHLNPKPGECVLDACAGLGTKTGLLAQLMQNRGKIMAIDHKNSKLNQLRREMDRLGVSIAEDVVLDLNRPLAGQKPPAGFGPFDRVLLDAPCSGLGVLRRNPDTKWSAGTDFQRYQKRQIKFLHHLASCVKPMGVLVYSVCSTEPEENEAVINSFLAAHAEFRVDDDHSRLPPFLKALMRASGWVKTFPHRNQMDGFFSIRLRKMSTKMDDGANRFSKASRSFMV